MARGITFTKDSPIIGLIGLALTEAGLRDAADASDRSGCCTTCGKPLQETEGTDGRGPLKTYIETDPIYLQGKVVGFYETKKFSSTTLKTCNDCCLTLVAKVRLDSQGHTVLNDQGEVLYTPNRTKFPETKG